MNAGRLTLAIGRDRSQKGSNTVEQKPQRLQVSELFSCPTNRSGRAQAVSVLTTRHRSEAATVRFQLAASSADDYLPTTLLSSLSKYLLHIFFPFSSSLNKQTEERQMENPTLFILTDSLAPLLTGGGPSPRRSLSA